MPPSEAEPPWHGEGNTNGVPNKPIAMQKTTLILQPAPSPAATVDQAEPTDEALMGRIQKRDEQALTMLYYRHGKLLRSVISRCVYDQQHSEDLLQEVYVEIWNRADHYSEEK